MSVTIRKGCFDLRAIMESGQCFRMRAVNERTVEAIAFGERVRVETLGQGRYAFDCDRRTFDRRWRAYFDLDADYAGMMAAAPKDDAFLKRAMAHGRGLRILRQEPWETLCCFIISQRKSIGAIRTCVDALCMRYGEPIDEECRAFPTPQRLAALSSDELRACALGYRAPYVLATARSVAEGAIDLAQSAELDDDALRERLTSLSGVGVKVANCVLLFGYHRLAGAPVDVWIQRVIDEQYGGVSPFEGYGAYAGVYQQYMFTLGRETGVGC